tara:strand:- start:2131 stop:3141 length:1011 start_codon:yes stop_codon:yes gene_type:complete
MKNFFIWCAGSDPHLLKHCPRRESIKHQGFGTLVLIPAILAFVSMSYALSTLDSLQEKPIFYLLGGLLWALIIFAFDRFIVSTHQKKSSHKQELKNPLFFLRLAFALLLGIVISHPLMMFYFKGSIDDQLVANQEKQKTLIEEKYENIIQENESKIAFYDSLYEAKLKERNKQANLVAQEIDGEVIQGKNGTQKTTGLYGEGPSAKRKIAQLNQLQAELNTLHLENTKRKNALFAENERLHVKSDSLVKDVELSTDYLQRELALEQLKEKNNIVSLTQWLLISLFVLVDILPLIFKTFSSFGLYDKMQETDQQALNQINPQKREQHIQALFDQSVS